MTYQAPFTVNFFHPVNKAEIEHSVIMAKQERAEAMAQQRRGERKAVIKDARGTTVAVYRD